LKNLFAFLLVFIVNCSIAQGGQTSCPENFPGGSAPEYTNPKVAAKTRLLCNEGYAVGHSGVTRTPLWSAEYLTRQRLEAGRGLPRVNAFRPDDRLPASERSELRDFERSGYDRGHMTPSGDAYSASSQSATFELSNMVPQDSENNRHLHNGIESAIRKETKRVGDLYVITGPIFEGTSLQALRGRVLIPTGLYKCLYYPRNNQAGCYVERNAPGMDYSVASVREVEKMTGISLFPAVQQAVKDRAIQLPAPKPFRGR
jgi:endonuclease G